MFGYVSSPRRPLSLSFAACLFLAGHFDASVFRSRPLPFPLFGCGAPPGQETCNAFLFRLSSGFLLSLRLSEVVKIPAPPLRAFAFQPAPGLLFGPVRSRPFSTSVGEFRSLRDSPRATSVLLLLGVRSSLLMTSRALSDSSDLR